MKKRFTEEQIVKILGEEAEGKKIKDSSLRVWNCFSNLLCMEEKILYYEC